MKLIIVRHGQAKCNLEPSTYSNGKLDELTRKGVVQAENAGKALKNYELSIIFSSPLRRNFHTARIINKNHNLEIIKDERISEVDFGIWKGMNKEEVKKRYPEIYHKRQESRYSFRIPDGESYEDIGKRVNNFLKHLKKNYESNVLVVTHEAVIRLIMKNLFDMKVDKNYDNCSITIVKINDKNIIKEFNNTSHL